MTKLSIIGLGYVGLVTAIGFSKLEYPVVGVDINEYRVAKIKLKKSPLNVEKLESHLKKYPFECYLGEHKKAVMNSDISFICVETPTRRSGNPNLRPLKKVCRTLGRILKNKTYHIIVIRSTIFPGSLEILKKVLEKYSKKRCGRDFDLLVNPEFLREKYAIDDFFDPSFIIVGGEEKVAKKVMKLYDEIDSKKFIVDEGIGQMIKYASNSWHSCKVSFTNEIGEICKYYGINGNKLMEIFCEDTKLNISPYYHKIGGAWGGNCLPKDLSVLQHNAKKIKRNFYLINSISKSNKEHKKEKI